MEQVLRGAAMAVVTRWILFGVSPRRHTREQVHRWVDARWQALSERMTRGAIT